MTGVSERLDAIEARKDAIGLLSFPGLLGETIDQIVVDRGFLLDLARKQQAAIDAVNGLMGELSAREDRWKAAYEKREMSHAEASSAALEDRWVYAQLAELLFPLNALEGK